ncbi:uncharacterized protein J7T54_000633 [Emericellopsis cladophorae]|uniref:Mediator of RNA polymerase II transcription subunit 8 n=1 Tax=Emericellopsis cladophorae TaxID=2686198 RepID=A0A9P9Y463_9HYPO|nr:uncharacterized protein J7T54_000633 [Emericellopsis cladophorae]KAI6783131.1 hypothetical protein J7T54_000633 [Emericellopsis cladophorae]
MAALMLDDDEFKSLESIVARLNQLNASIQSLRADIFNAHPLPPPSSFQASSQIIQKNLQSLLDTINDNAVLLDTIAIHPSTNYPGRTQEGLLTNLLRKKLEPQTEELVDKGRTMSDEATKEGMDKMMEVWSGVREWMSERVREYVTEEAGDFYTREERDEIGVENVRTGLKRDLYEDEDEDEEMEGAEPKPPKAEAPKEEEKVVTRGPELETLLWFMARGDFMVPPNVEYERKGGSYRGLQGVNIPQQTLQQQAQEQQAQAQEQQRQQQQHQMGQPG